MMDSYFNSKPKDFEESPLHKITTDHPYMATLGLSVMTTGMLYRWWNKQNEKGEYVNHKYFAKDPASIQNKTNPKIILLGEDLSTNKDKAGPGADQFSFLAWRRETNGAGTYHKKYADGGHSELWNFVQGGDNEAGQPRNYSYSELKLDEYDDIFLEADPTDPDGFKKQNVWEMVDGKGQEQDIPFLGVGPITNIIALNEYVDNLDNSTFDRSSWSQTEFARLEFINDIQASKNVCVEWSGYIPFYISTAKGDIDPATGLEKDTFVCERSDWVKFKLHLFDSSMDTSSNRGIAMANPTFAAPPVDSLGRKYAIREDGRFSAFPEGSQSAEVVADLDLTYNEHTGKWEAGSKQMVATVSQTIPPANVLSSDSLRNLTPEEMLASPNDPNSHIIFGSGSAIPLNMQNGNPMQWTPNYAQSSETDINGKFLPNCPKEGTEKASLRVFNASSKSLDTNQMVLLNQIDGIWFAIDFPSGIEGDTAVSAGFDGKWEFTYCATNVVHFFRDYDFKLIKPFDVHVGLHKIYYSGDALNQTTYESSPYDPLDGGTDTRYIAGGWAQFTSFDFMDEQTAGLRGLGPNDSAAKNKNGLVITNSQVDPNGETVVSDGNGEKTAGFFGCIFPDGYNSQDIAKWRVDRQYDAVSRVRYSGGIGGFDKYEYGSVNRGVALDYFNGQALNTEICIAKDVKPFNDGVARHDWIAGGQHKDGNGVPVPIFKDDDTSLSQLPADIGTNASPGGDNGQPIKSIVYLDHILKASTANAVEDRIRDYFNWGQHWLAKSQLDGNGKQVYEDHLDEASSAFNFRPSVPNHIMFRPLKAEAYAQFQDKMYIPDAEAGGRQWMQQSIAQRMKSNVPAGAELARKREFEISQANSPFLWSNAGMLGQLTSLWNFHWGLMWNIDIPSYDTKGADFKISPKAYIKDGGTAGRFRDDYFGYNTSNFTGNKWMHGEALGGAKSAGTNPTWKDVGDYQPAGAVGVIGAVATCTANRKIMCHTQQTLGVWSVTTLNTFLKEAAWGKSNAYNGFGTTNLFVKVYQHWPREQTIYDPRWFCVHHFNAGVTDFVEPALAANEDKYVKKRKVVTLSQSNAAGETKQYEYFVNEPTYDIDIRVPSCKELAANLKERDPNVPGSQLNLPVTVAQGGRVFGTKTVTGGNIHEALDRQYWNIDTRRRAKLLPYKYRQDTVTIPRLRIVLPSYDLGVVDDGQGNKEEVVYKNGGYAIRYKGTSTIIDNVEYLDTEAIPFYDKAEADPNKRNKTFNWFNNGSSDDIMVMIKNPGQDYKIGDTFTVATTVGTDFLMEVFAVEDPQNDPTGGKKRIKELRVRSTGRDFENTGFTDTHKDRDISKASTGVSVFNGGSQPSENGKGLNCQFTQGTVWYVERIDDKPLIATGAEQIRISAKSNAQDDGDGSAPVFGLDTSDFDQDIDIANPSSDKKYDLFFHFHNDISHTWMLQDFKNSVSRWGNDEQHIDLTISVD